MDVDDTLGTTGEFYADLHDLFHHNDYTAFFRNIPVEQHNQALNELNAALRSRYRHPTHRENTYVSLVWFLNVFPLPVVKYRRLWNDFHHNMGLILIRVLSLAFVAATRMFRLAMFLVGSSFYIQRIAKDVFACANVLTFSNNFFKDIFTFLFRNRASVFRQFQVIETRGLRYLIAPDDFHEPLIWAYFKGTLYHSLLLQLKAKCFSDPEGKVTCVADDTLLIFKFNDVFEQALPQIDVTLVVITVYLAYALIGNFICMNVLYLYTLDVVRKFSKYTTYFHNLAKLAWKGFYSSIA